MSDHLYTCFALPDHPHLDGFTSGVAEVDAYFRERKWFKLEANRASPPTYQFLNKEGGDVIGYASAAPRKMPHPDDQGDAQAKYFVVYVVGVCTRFQGYENPRAPGETYAVSILRVLEGLSIKANCVGLSLWVRVDNPRAIAFYEKIGFEKDVGGAIERDDKASHITMRKAL